MDGESLNVVDERMEQLKNLLPEAFSEGKVDWEKLRLTLGDDINVSDERYVLNWAGKGDAFRALQTSTTATLTPVENESINFNETKNIFIEGENLEVLKVLQKAYYGKIKMIYIDPPYNTGNDSFVYPDRFSESREDYLKRIQAKDGSGTLLKEEMFRPNSRDSGHYHSNWLSMMLPRLYLARNLLSEDGIIFISIDDNEVHNLRLLMNEIFGEENFVASIVWQRKQSPQNDAIYFSAMHDYVLVYAKKVKSFREDPVGWQRILLPRGEKQNDRYENTDNDPRGPWTSVDYTSNKTAEERPNLFYAIINPNTGEEVWPSRQRVWRFSRETHAKNDKEKRVWWGSGGNNFPRFKRFLSEVSDGIVPSTWWDRRFAGDNQSARRELRSLFTDMEDAFDTPKPVKLIKKMLQVAMKHDEGSIVLDFFAGSATTAQAVIEKNIEEQGNSKFIMVQYPEPTGNREFPTISSIGMERIRRVLEKIKKENPMFSINSQNFGFKVFKLKQSNFKLWRGDGLDSQEELEKQLDLMEDPVYAEALEENLLFELLLKSGYLLTTQVDKHSIGKAHYYLVDGKMAIALSCLNEDIIQNMLKVAPQQVICLDSLFADNDALKTNTQLQFKNAGIAFHSI